MSRTNRTISPITINYSPNLPANMRRALNGHDGASAMLVDAGGVIHTSKKWFTKRLFNKRLRQQGKVLLKQELFGDRNYDLTTPPDATYERYEAYETWDDLYEDLYTDDLEIDRMVAEQDDYYDDFYYDYDDAFYDPFDDMMPIRPTHKAGFNDNERDRLVEAYLGGENIEAA